MQPVEISGSTGTGRSAPGAEAEALPQPYAAIILAGGAGRRLGGPDKPLIVVRGRPMLHWVLDAVSDAVERVVVGPPTLRLPPDDGLRTPGLNGQHPERDAGRRAVIRRVLEEPPGGGPVAAVAAGLAGVSAPVVAVLAADLPFLDRAAVATLRATLAGSAAAAGLAGPAVAAGLAGPAAAATSGVSGVSGGSGVDGVVFVDRGGRRQTLCGVWRTPALRAALSAVGPPAGVALRAVLGRLRVGEIPPSTGAGRLPPWYDCDGPDDLRRAREHDARRHDEDSRGTEAHVRS